MHHFMKPCIIELKLITVKIEYFMSTSFTSEINVTNDSVF